MFYRFPSLQRFHFVRTDGLPPLETRARDDRPLTTTNTNVPSPDASRRASQVREQGEGKGRGGATHRKRRFATLRYARVIRFAIQQRRYMKVAPAPLFAAFLFEDSASLRRGAYTQSRHLLPEGSFCTACALTHARTHAPVVRVVARYRV